NDAVDRIVAAAIRDRLQVGEFVFHQGEPAAGRAHEVGAARDRIVIAIDADDVAVCGRENCTAVAADTEGGVDIDTARAHIETFDRAAAEHGNATSQSASDSARAATARPHARAPCV